MNINQGKLSIKLLKAKKGDCVIIETDTESILIDGGTASTVGEIKRRLNTKKNIFVFVTHYDYDHSGGILKYLQNRKKEEPAVNLYINAPNHYPLDSSDLVANNHAKSIIDLIRSDDIVNTAIAGDSISLRNGSISILNPDQATYQKLEKQFREYCSKTVNDIGDGKVGSPGKVTIDFNAALNTTVTEYHTDQDLHNKSSIVALLELHQKKIFLLGDCHAASAIAALDKLGHDRQNPLECDLVKISHHGSKHNTTNDLLARIRCNKFIFLTNGSGNYYHPDKEILEIALRQSVHFKFNECYFYFNYENVKNNIKVINIPDSFTVNLIYTDEILI